MNSQERWDAIELPKETEQGVFDLIDRFLDCPVEFTSQIKWLILRKRQSANIRYRLNARGLENMWDLHNRTIIETSLFATAISDLLSLGFTQQEAILLYEALDELTISS